MPLPLLATAGIAAIPSLVQGISGLLGIGKGNRMAKANKRPIEQVNENIAKNAAMAEQMAQVGLSQQQYNQALQNQQRNFNGATTALGRSANPSAGLAGLLRASNDATLNLDVQDAQARQNNQRFAFGQRAQLANEQNRVWDWNNRRKFQENAQAAAETIKAGRANSMNALSNLSQLGQSVASGQFGKGQSSSSGQPQQAFQSYDNGNMVPFGTTYNRFNNTSSNRLY